METKKESKDVDSSCRLRLDYELLALPSSQHRTGLVGLVMMVRHLHAIGIEKQDADVVELNARGTSFEFTKIGMQALFDSAYAATWGEKERTTKYKDQNKVEVPPIRTERRMVVDEKGKEKEKTFYIYPKPVPGGAYLAKHDPGGERGHWIKLWRDMLWAIPRGKPTTRRAFEARAEGEQVQDGVKVYERLSGNPHKSVALASTYFLGAQETTANGVTFSDSARHQLLLHFWPFATEVFVPETVTRKGESKFDGYVLVFPDVADLKTYCDDYVDFLRTRSTDRHAYRPKQAVVDLPGEAGLRAMGWLSRILEVRVQQSLTVSLEDLVLAVDVVHARKDRKNVRILAIMRIGVNETQFREYERFTQLELWSTTFRKQWLNNILAERPWYTDFATLMTTVPSELTFKNSKFQHDAYIALEKDTNMTGENNLTRLLYKLTRNYLGGRMMSKHNLTWNSVKNDPKLSKKYTDDRNKLARAALLAMRSRTGDDFIEYVATQVFSVTQGLNEDDCTRVTKELFEKTETFRALLMITFSANMWSYKPE